MARYLDSLVVQEGQVPDYYRQSRINIRTMLSPIEIALVRTPLPYPDDLYLDQMIRAKDRILGEIQSAASRAPDIRAFDEQIEHVEAERHAARQRGRVPRHMAEQEAPVFSRRRSTQRSGGVAQGRVNSRAVRRAVRGGYQVPPPPRRRGSSQGGSPSHVSETPRRNRFSPAFTAWPAW